MRCTVAFVLLLVGCQGALDDGLQQLEVPAATQDPPADDPTPPALTTQACGNGVIDPGETCDGNCTLCDDGDACTQNQRVGAPGTCNVECVYREITVCRQAADGCCPDGCGAGTDADCSGGCGNGVVDGLETCDGNCPTSCPQVAGCGVMGLVGSAAACNAKCQLVSTTTSCKHGDGCCPNGCSASSDSDCSATCGNGTINAGETCDGNCPSSCADNNSCTKDVATGDASTCSLQCQHTNIAACVHNDGCCPGACNANNDSDCWTECGNGILEPGEECDGNCPTSCPNSGCDAMALSGSAQTCSAKCVATGQSVCTNNPSAPIAIAKLRAADPANPNAPYTLANDIDPLDRVYLDGRAKGTVTSSHDPASPANTARITSYLWEVIEAPPGLNPDDYTPQGQGTGLYNFFVPLAGHYVVRLTVTNVDGLSSADTAAARVTFDAIPNSAFHVQLVWDNGVSDSDLWLGRVAPGGQKCLADNSCAFTNRKPRWFDDSATGEGPNPRLDIDDWYGYGPENINIDEPNPGTYEVYVTHPGPDGDSDKTSLNTVRIWLNGAPVAEYTRTLVYMDTWAVAVITWSANGTPTVTPYPSDSGGQVGTVTNGHSCR